MKWEYKIYRYNNSDYEGRKLTEKRMQEFGEEGWELVSVIYVEGKLNTIELFFKRSLTS